MRFLDVVTSWIRQAMNDGWHWVTTLNLHEWFLLLGFTAGCGFLAMRGFSHKDRC